ncbi:MAG TPA: kynureninase [Steroidobacteraceae bacterium]|nr:kynureninase [Steroidobacteraceae bacterium]
MTYEPTLDHARERDAADPLRAYRQRFAMPTDSRGRDLVYLCGHSLGLMPLAAREAVLEEMDDWARLAVHGHEGARRPWIPYHDNLAPGLAYLTGAAVNEVIAMNSLTANLHFMLASFYRPAGRRVKILIEAGAFSSDRHAVASQLEWHGIDAQAGLIELGPHPSQDLVTPEAIEACLEQIGEEIALVLWPGVQFRTGQSFDLARIARAARRAGCIVGFDLAHSIGNTPLALHEADVDFAVWCGYKYLNGGPGAIGGCFIHERHSQRTPRLSGWWGHELTTRFQMEPGFRAAGGAAGWAVSNPPILSAAPLLASLKIFREAGFERLREKSLALTGFLELLLEQLEPQVRIISPRDAAARGCQLSLRITGTPTRGKRVFDTLRERGVVCDWREPNVIRAAPVPLYNTFTDVFTFADELQRALGEIQA